MNVVVSHGLALYIHGARNLGAHDSGIMGYKSPVTGEAKLLPQHLIGKSGFCKLFVFSFF